jgi:(1->4)-alpha-D-glucan 1-alpha-D-glucosylmutase
MSPLSTHDTKRSEDVRARINVLSEIPKEWGDAVRRWFSQNAIHRKELDGNQVPDANEEYLIYQTLIGVWPARADEPGEEFSGRIKAYIVKALHEAKIHSSWLNPNTDYDAAVQEFVGRILNPESGNSFLNDFRPFQKRVASFGAINSLAQTLLKFTVPGVADTYQGTEVPDFSLVDPDNRRPVDYGRRQAMLKELRERVDSCGKDLASFARELTEDAENGRAKLYVTWRALHARRKYTGLFTKGEYHPLASAGLQSGHIFAFARRQNGVTAVVAVPRLPARLNASSEKPTLDPGVWADTRLNLTDSDPNARWVNVFCKSELIAKNGELAAADLFSHFPVALLIQE